jgi:hypothetical protein
MNDTEATRIAAAINQLRPDWPAPSLRTLLARPELATRPRRDVAVALTWVACESTTQTPARVLEHGPWWRAAQTGSDATRHPPRRGQACNHHPGEWPDTCRGCAGDRLAGDRTTPAAEATNASEWATRIRGTLRGGDA